MAVMKVERWAVERESKRDVLKAVRTVRQRDG
jgi:hypothetical protein